VRDGIEESSSVVSDCWRWAIFDPIEYADPHHCRASKGKSCAWCCLDDPVVESDRFVCESGMERYLF
jgi:hypothetical protein